MDSLQYRYEMNLMRLLMKIKSGIVMQYELVPAKKLPYPESEIQHKRDNASESLFYS